MQYCLFLRYEELNSEKPVQQERQFVVFESSIARLLQNCPTCYNPCTAKIINITGGCINVEQVCFCLFCFALGTIIHYIATTMSHHTFQLLGGFFIVCDLKSIKFNGERSHNLVFKDVVICCNLFSIHTNCFGSYRYYV